MRILVTGATGFLGGALVRRLLARGHEVTALTRADPAGARLPLRATVARWDPARPAPIGDEPPFDAVVHLAGEPVSGRWTARKRQAILSSRVEGTRSVVTGIAAAQARPARLVCASAIGFYGDRGEELLDERSTQGTDFLAGVCERWEAAAAGARELGVTVTNARLGLVLGRGGGALPPLRRATLLGAGGPLGPGRQWWSWIHLEDAVRAIEHALDAGPDGALNVTSEPVRQRDVARALGRALGRPALAPAPAAALRLALGGFAAELLSSRRVASTRLTESGFAHRFADLDAALADLCRPGAPRGDIAVRHVGGSRWVLECAVRIERPLDEVFPFFADAHNLERITPPWLAFHVLTPAPVRMERGTRIDYRLRLRGVPIRWTSAIDVWEPPHRFVDRQLRGPYRSWRHEHTFREDGGATVVEDRVELDVPGGPAAGRLVAAEVRRIFAYRHEQLLDAFL